MKIGLQLLKSCIRKIKVNYKNDQPVVFKILYDVCKMEFFSSTRKIELLLSISFLLCTSSRVLAVVQIMWEKPKEIYIDDVLNTHGIVFFVKS